MLKQIMVACLLFVSGAGFANDKKPENQSTVFNETFSWQIQMGFSGQYTDVLLTDVTLEDLNNFVNISLLLDFYYKGFFIQSNHRRSITHALGAEIGYQLITDEDWELDIISRTYIGGIMPETIMDIADRHIAIIDGIDKRDYGEGVGLRYTRYFDDSQFSVDIANLSALSDATGWIAEAFYTHIVPYRNWDIYLNGSVTYYPANVNDYYTGVDLHEVSDIRPAYEADDTFKLQLEVFTQHPISESWTFNAGLSFTKYTDDIDDSPLIEQSHAVTAMLGVLYVF